MLTLLSILIVSILGGVIFYKKLTTVTEHGRWIGAYILITFVAMFLTSMFFSMAGAEDCFKNIKNTYNCNLVPINGSYFNINVDRYGNTNYGYSFDTGGDQILTSSTKNFVKIPDGQTPYCKITEYESSLGNWGFGLSNSNKYSFVVCVPIEILSKINAESTTK